MDYEHKGTKITLDARDGTFGATIGPRLRFFPSLAAAKKAVEAHIAEAFEPFDAICEPGYKRKMKAGESPWFEIHKPTDPAADAFLESIKKMKPYEEPKVYVVNASTKACK